VVPPPISFTAPPGAFAAVEAPERGLLTEGLPRISLSNQNVLLDEGLKIFTADNKELAIQDSVAVLYFDICVYKKTVIAKDILFRLDHLDGGIGSAEIEIAKYEYDPGVPSGEMQPLLIGVYPATLGAVSQGSIFDNGMTAFIIGATGLSHNLGTGTYRISLVLRDGHISALGKRTLYSFGMTGSGGDVQIVATHLDIITFGVSLKLAPEDTLKAFFEAYGAQFSEETEKKEQERIAAKIPYERPIMLTINGSPIITDSPPVIERERTLVPVRALVEALGYVVAWDPSSRTVDIYDQRTFKCVISMTIDKDSAYVYNEAEQGREEVLLDVPAMIINDRTMIPARFIAESLGCPVDWDSETRTVKVTYQIETKG
jgi:hypothetical protein